MANSCIFTNFKTMGHEFSIYEYRIRAGNLPRGGAPVDHASPERHPGRQQATPGGGFSGHLLMRRTAVTDDVPVTRVTDERLRASIDHVLPSPSPLLTTPLHVTKRQR